MTHEDLLAIEDITHIACSREPVRGGYVEVTADKKEFDQLIDTAIAAHTLLDVVTGVINILEDKEEPFQHLAKNLRTIVNGIQVAR